MTDEPKLEDVARLAIDTANVLSTIGPSSLAQQLVMRAMIEALAETHPGFLKRFDDALCREMDGKAPELIQAIGAFIGAGEPGAEAERAGDHVPAVTAH